MSTELQLAAFSSNKLPIILQNMLIPINAQKKCQHYLSGTTYFVYAEGYFIFHF